MKDCLKTKTIPKDIANGCNQIFFKTQNIKMVLFSVRSASSEENFRQVLLYVKTSIQDMIPSGSAKKNERKWKKNKLSLLIYFSFFSF